MVDDWSLKGKGINDMKTDNRYFMDTDIETLRQKLIEDMAEYSHYHSGYYIPPYDAVRIINKRFGIEE